MKKMPIRSLLLAACLTTCFACSKDVKVPHAQTKNNAVTKTNTPATTQAPVQNPNQSSGCPNHTGSNGPYNGGYGGGG